MAHHSEPRTVLITGAAKRLGREIALALATSGWRVAVHYRSSESDAKDTALACSALTAGSEHFQADLDNELETQQLLPTVIARMGRVDAVINNASTFEFDNAKDFSYSHFSKHMLGNVAAPITLAKALFDHLSPREGHGVVLNLLDQKLWNINPDFLSYSLSKSALQMANSMLAQALAPVVRVCAIAPGLTYPSYLQGDEDFERTSKLSLTGKISHPKDIAKAAVFMMETPSITGATLLVDAGQHLTAMPRDISFL